MSDEVSRKEIKLGGRAFRVIDYDRRTVELDHHVGRLIRKTCVDKVVPMPEDGEGDSAVIAYTVRLQTALLDSGNACEIIAGFLLPEGRVERDWTPQMGRDTAAFIRKLDTQEDRDMVLQLAAEAVLGFFRREIVRLFVIRSSLAAMTSRSEPAATRAAH